MEVIAQGNVQLPNHSKDDTEISAWSELCLRCFENDKEEGIEAALAYFDLHCRTDVQIEQPPPPPAEAAPLLRAAGLLDLEGYAMTLSSDRYVSYVTAKNEARKLAHARFHAAKRAKLGELLVQRVEPAVSSVSWDVHEQMRRAIYNFVRKYEGSMGTHPFIKGLRLLLQRQLNDERLWHWILSEESLIEAGTSEFVADAVNLLFVCSRKVSVIEDPTRSYWELPADISDSRIYSLLRQFPSKHKLEGSATGDLVQTSIERTNMKGQLDESRWSCSLL